MIDRERDEQLEKMLKRPEAYIDDAGFTDRVVNALPSRPVSNRLRTGVLALSVIIAFTVVIILTPLSTLNSCSKSAYSFLFTILHTSMALGHGSALFSQFHSTPMVITNLCIGLMLVWGALIVARSR
jgi:hypothetical protein